MPLTYIARMGGKFRLRKKLVSLFPPNYTTFVEVFAGSAQVFLELEKQPHVRYVLNDKNKDIYDLWKDLQTIDPDIVRQFVFPQSKQLFDHLKQETHLADKTQRLYRNLYLSLFSFSNNRIAFIKKKPTTGEHILRNVEQLQKKLKKVTILNQDYKKVIAKYDSPHTMFYLDPPYEQMEKYYQGQTVDPYELAEVCRGIQGKFMLSYNISKTVRDAFQGFHFHKIKVPYTSGLGSKTKYEYLITNYDV
jgi:DNA adenine methylase